VTKDDDQFPLDSAGDMSQTVPTLDNWAFGSGGFAKIYGERLAQSSLMDLAVATRWLFFWMLSQADSEGRYRCATIAALARAANVSEAEAERAIHDLSSPDPDSTTTTHEGRRLIKIPGGWKIVTYGKYRDYRTERQEAERLRKQKYRSRKGGDKSRDVPGTSSAVPGESAPDVRRKTQDTRDGERTPPPPEAASEDLEDLGVSEVFAYWRAKTGKTKAILTDARRKALKRRLEEDPDRVSGLKAAVDGAILDPWFNGTDNGGKRLWDFENIFVHEGRNRIEKLQGSAARYGASVPLPVDASPEPVGLVERYFTESKLTPMTLAQRFVEETKCTTGEGAIEAWNEWTERNKIPIPFGLVNVAVFHAQKESGGE
jgi:hypothetical protein